MGRNTQVTIYEQFGLKTIINAAGTLTRLGGTLLAPEVSDAMSEAAKAMVPVDELQAAASNINDSPPMFTVFMYTKVPQAFV